MTAATTPMPPVLIVLRQVEGPNWCVVRHEVRDGKRLFAGRIATAREYGLAYKVAMEAAWRARLPLGIQGNGERLRPFSIHRDIPKQGAR